MKSLKLALSSNNAAVAALFNGSDDDAYHNLSKAFKLIRRAATCVQHRLRNPNSSARRRTAAKDTRVDNTTGKICFERQSFSTNNGSKEFEFITACVASGGMDSKPRNVDILSAMITYNLSLLHRVWARRWEDSTHYSRSARDVCYQKALHLFSAADALLPGAVGRKTFINEDDCSIRDLSYFLRLANEQHISEIRQELGNSDQSRQGCEYLANLTPTVRPSECREVLGRSRYDAVLMMSTSMAAAHKTRF